MTVDRAALKVKIIETWCKGCGICVAFCPKHVLSLNSSQIVQMDDDLGCIRCGRCEMRCPDFAIYLGEAEHGR